MIATTQDVAAVFDTAAEGSDTLSPPSTRETSSIVQPHPKPAADAVALLERAVWHLQEGRPTEAGLFGRLALEAHLRQRAIAMGCQADPNTCPKRWLYKRGALTGAERHIIQLANELGNIACHEAEGLTPDYSEVMLLAVGVVIGKD